MNENKGMDTLNVFKLLLTKEWDECTSTPDRMMINIIFEGLETIEFIIKSMSDNFPVEKAPNYVYLFDLKRYMFWKQTSQGYTANIYDAGLFELEYALEKVENDYNKNTKLVYFE